MREQLWIVPGADAAYPLRATLFRPPASPSPKARLPLVVINHGTDDNTRLSVSMPVYYWLSRWFVERGFAVLLPQRRGHGATGGPLAEAVGNCANPDHLRSGLEAAKDINAAVTFMRQQPFIDEQQVIAVGVSSGGWASLALASAQPDSLRAIVNFAGGRGGHANGERLQICGESNLISATAAYAASARIPTRWYYSRNDSFFPPRIAKALAKTWREAGGHVELSVIKPYGSEGHRIADDRAGWDLWGTSLDRFLAQVMQSDTVDNKDSMPEQHAARFPIVLQETRVPGLR